MKTPFCVYLTVYRGNKLPPFYIGYSSIKKIDAGYHGSVSSAKYKNIWKMELKEQPHLFKTYVLTQRATQQEAKIREAEIQRSFNVHTNPMYINAHINGELFFCDRTGSVWSDEQKQHMSNLKKGHKHTNETRRKISQSRKGIVFSKSHRQKIGEVVRARAPDSQETKRRKSESHIGKKHSLETRAKIGASRKNRNTHSLISD